MAKSLGLILWTSKEKGFFKPRSHQKKKKKKKNLKKEKKSCPSECLFTKGNRGVVFFVF
jgi:hypothetical protein